MLDIRLSLLQRHLEAGHLDRRAFIRGALALGFSSSAIGTALAACGGGGNSTPTTPGTKAVSPSTGAQATPTSAGVTINQNATPGTGTTVAPAAASSSAPAKSGGSVTFVRSVDSTSADPILWHNPDIWPFMNVYDQLVKVGPDGTSLIPGLAEKWETSSDGLTYTFHLRQGVKFSDGTPMTSTDVKWSLDRAKADTKGGWNFTLMQVKEVAAPDPNTVVITLTGQWAPFLSDISMFNASIISKAFADKVGVDKLTEQQMGTGPFALKEWKRADQIVFVKNPNYWEAGLPYLDQITLRTVPDTNAQILQLQGGQVDGIIGQGDVPFNRVPDLQKDPKLQVVKFLSTYINYVFLNTKHPPLGDIKFRQALNYATDNKSLIDTILFRNGEIANSFMPNGMLYWNKDQQPFPFDLTQANQLISQSTSPNGANFAFLVSSGNALQLQLATALKSMWSKIKVNVDIQQVDAAVARQNTLDEKYDSVLSSWTNDIIDPDELVSYAILPESNDNFHTGWKNQQAIDLAHQAQTTLDPDKRRALYYQIQQIHKDDAAAVYLFVIPYIDVLTKNVQGFFHHPMGQYIWTKVALAS